MQPTDERAWQAVLARDRSFDGSFVTGVHSTGIYCRPSCSARHPKRENVSFFAGPQEAAEAGLRACRRCRPDELRRDEEAIARALTILDDPEAPHSLAELGAATGYSPAHLQRIFTAALGLSPSQYARARRFARAGDALSAGTPVLESAYASGFGASSALYDQGSLGMTPSIWRHQGAGASIWWAVPMTTLGPVLVAVTEKGVCRVAFGEGEEHLKERFAKATLIAASGEQLALIEQVIALVEEPTQAHNLPLDVQGTAFQEAVWQQLQAIPAGQVRSYAQLAAAIGQPTATRAVGSANGANHLAVLIPCHRVVRADGSVGGYAYGTQIKTELLRREGRR